MIRSIYTLALLLAALVPSAADASYISNYARWKEISPVEKAAYLAGVMDRFTRTSTPGEPSWMAATRTGINKCAREQQISSVMLVDLVDEHYKTIPADRRVPPASLIGHIMTLVCLADINSEREKAGYSAWERKPAQFSNDTGN